MIILVETHHPAHVHFFKNPIRIWLNSGHKVIVAGRNRSVMPELLKHCCKAPYTLLTKVRQNNRFPILEFIERQIKFLSLVKKSNCDVVVSLMGVYTQTSRLLSRINIIFTDSEFQKTAHMIAHPFADFIVTPKSFGRQFGKKQLLYNGYHELSYLHPRWFQPDPNVLKKAGVVPFEYSVVRLISWNTMHDASHHGFDITGRDSILQMLSNFGTVYLSQEDSPDHVINGCSPIPVSPWDIHHLLAFSKICVTEGRTMASEAAIMGTPTVFMNSLGASYLYDLQNRYGLLRCHSSVNKAKESIQELIETPNIRNKLQPKRDRMLVETIDVASYSANLVTNLISHK